MKFKNPFKRRGLPDYAHHEQNDNSTVVPISPAAPPISTLTAVSEPLYPVSYPSDNNYGYNSHTSTIYQPPTAYPYRIQPDPPAKSGAVWEFNAGNNVNKKGQQRGGNVAAANSATGSALPLSLPQNGRFVFNTGSNVNEGELQESGNVDFANAGCGALQK